jgi:hypothetical protein
MSIGDILKKRIEIIKRLIRYYQILLAIEKNKPKPTEERILKEITFTANCWGVDPSLAVKVAKCESNLDPFAIGLCPNGSIDRGLYQINDKWHPEMKDEDCFDYKKSIHFFCQAAKLGNLLWWNASKECWSK